MWVKNDTIFIIVISFCGIRTLIKRPGIGEPQLPIGVLGIVPIYGPIVSVCPYISITSASSLIRD